MNAAMQKVLPALSSMLRASMLLLNSQFLFFLVEEAEVKVCLRFSRAWDSPYRHYLPSFYSLSTSM